jgi:hypothetical protein
LLEDLTKALGALGQPDKTRQRDKKDV